MGRTRVRFNCCTLDVAIARRACQLPQALTTTLVPGKSRNSSHESTKIRLSKLSSAIRSFRANAPCPLKLCVIAMTSKPPRCLAWSLIDTSDSISTVRVSRRPQVLTSTGILKSVKERCGEVLEKWSSNFPLKWRWLMRFYKVRSWSLNLGVEGGTKKVISRRPRFLNTWIIGGLCTLSSRLETRLDMT